MDTFIDKLAQKTIANDMINANAAAEARENQKIAEQLAGYDELLQQMKQVNLKNMESAAKVTEMLEGVNFKSEEPVSAGISAEDMEELKSSLDGKADEIVRAGEDTANSVKYAAEDAVLSVKLSAEDVVKSVSGSIDDVKTSAQEAVSTLKTSADEAVEALKTSADEAIASVKTAGESTAEEVAKSTEDIKAAAQSSADEIKKAAEEGVEGMKQASSESVESMKQASEDATETIRKVVEEGLEAIKGASEGVVRGEAPQAQMDQTYLDAQFDDVHDAIHTENVKVYRNVQAAVDDSLADQTKAIRGYIERSQKDGSKLPLVLGIANFALNVIIIALLVLNALGVF